MSLHPTQPKSLWSSWGQILAAICLISFSSNPRSSGFSKKRLQEGLKPPSADKSVSSTSELLLGILRTGSEFPASEEATSCSDWRWKMQRLCHIQPWDSLRSISLLVNETSKTVRRFWGSRHDLPESKLTLAVLLRKLRQNFLRFS